MADQQENFIMPAEWEKHSAVWLAWPHDTISFGSLNEPEGRMDKNRLQRVEQKFVEIIKAIHTTEEVELLVLDEEMKNKVEEMLKAASVDLKKITFHITPYADVWLRDFGPMFISNPKTRELAWIKWAYNAYNNKFPDLLKDNEVFFNLRKDIDRRMFEPGMVLEGGSIEVNGNGACITTEQCLLENNRNPGFDRKKIERYLKGYLGVNKTIWLKKGLLNDHTDGHIDNVAKFVSANKILCAYEENPEEKNYEILKANYEILASTTDHEGKSFEVIKLPMPHMDFNDGKRAPASYANAYIGNGIVLAETFNDPNDAKALEIIQACFLDRKIVPIDCTDIIYGGGAIHCMTQQQPLI